MYFQRMSAIYLSVHIYLYDIAHSPLYDVSTMASMKNSS